MNPVPVWQPTQAVLPAGSSVVTACIELFHSLPFTWCVAAEWHWLQTPELVELTEIATMSPPDAACKLPGPWQFSHWMLARFFNASGIASKLPGFNVVGGVHPSCFIMSSNPPSAIGLAGS